MENVILDSSNATLKRTKTNELKVKKDRNYPLAAAFCFGSGGLCSFIGLLMPVVLGFFQRNNRFFGYAGSVLLIVSLILFGFGAHFMDKAEESEKQSKRL